MSKCPYTWFVGLFSNSESKGSGVANNLRVTVYKNNERVVDVALPANSARWLIDIIPTDVVTKIRQEGVPLDAIQSELAKAEVLSPQKIFKLEEPHRSVDVWLE